MVSRCCKTEIFSHGEYYSCLRCHKPCDLVNFKATTKSGYSEYKKWNSALNENIIGEDLNVKQRSY